MSKGALVALSSRLETVPEPDPPRFVGIYLLVDGEEIVYVGQSTNVIQRVSAHKANRNHHHERWRTKWDRAFWMPVANDDLDDYEGALIRRLTPRYNTSAPGSGLRDAEICAQFDLPPCDLARLAEFRARRHEAFILPGEKRSELAKRKKADRLKFEKRHGIRWIRDWDVRRRLLARKAFWKAIKPLLDEAKAS